MPQAAGPAPPTSLGDLGGCDLVIEAAPEDLGLKRELFARWPRACGPEAILATNTSSLPSPRSPPWCPARARRRHALLQPAGADEAGRGRRHRRAPRPPRSTRPTEVGMRMGRTPIRAKDSPGFIANRLARPFTLESLRMLADGVADAATIDRVCRLGGGFRMGPFELIDLIGLDVNLSVARSFYAQGGEPERWRPSAIQEGSSPKASWAARAAAASTTTASDAAPRARRPGPRHRGTDARPRRLARDRPGGPQRSSPASSPRSPTRRPSRSKRRSARPSRHGHGDAARLQLAPSARSS